MVLSAGVLVVYVWSAGGHQQFVVVGVGQVDLLCSLLWSWSESWKDDRVVVCGMIREGISNNYLSVYFRCVWDASCELFQSHHCQACDPIHRLSCPTCSSYQLCSAISWDVHY